MQRMQRSGWIVCAVSVVILVIAVCFAPNRKPSPRPLHGVIFEGVAEVVENPGPDSDGRVTVRVRFTDPLDDSLVGKERVAYLGTTTDLREIKKGVKVKVALARLGAKEELFVFLGGDLLIK